MFRTSKYFYVVNHNQRPPAKISNDQLLSENTTSLEHQAAKARSLLVFLVFLVFLLGGFINRIGLLLILLPMFLLSLRRLTWHGRLRTTTLLLQELLRFPHL